MSVIFVILGFVLICLILVHVNLHQKRKELYSFIETANKTLAKRHKKISKLIKLLEENDLSKDIRKLNEKTIEQIKMNEIKPSQAIRAEILLEDKMNQLLELLKNKELSQEVIDAIESYNKTQIKVEKNKKKYNEIITQFMDACSIKPAPWYASFEHIDTDFPKISPISE